jgi:hypothetical protein
MLRRPAPEDLLFTASIDTSKPASDRRVKTGHWSRRRRDGVGAYRTQSVAGKRRGRTDEPRGKSRMFVYVG